MILFCSLSFYKPATEKCLSQLLSKEEKPTAPSDSGSSIPPSSPKVPQKPQKSSEDHNNKIKQDKVDVEGGYRAHDFDYVTRQIETLVHVSKYYNYYITSHYCISLHYNEPKDHVTEQDLLEGDRYQQVP